VQAPLTLLLTRPRAQAGAWLQRLAALGVQAQALPLIEIAAAEDAEPARQAWQALPQARLAMFVSPNAVTHFFAAAASSGRTWPADALAATVGPGSAQALREAGVPAAQIVQPPPESASLDSEHLWPQLAGHDWQGRLALILRGDGGRDWLAERLRERGAEVREYGVYRRRCPHWSQGERQLLGQVLAEPARHVWLFSSSEAIGHLETLAGTGADWSRGLAIATHERIAQRVRSLGMGHVVLARPDAVAVAEALRVLQTRPLQSFGP
jgi:uroporphyrinogen-III synthase